MTHTEMLEAYPKDLGGIDKERLAECIEACFECAQTCTACADACLSEDMVAELTKCIRTNLDCSDICAATGNTLSRHTGYDANLTSTFLEACATACKACGDECSQHHARALPDLRRRLPSLRTGLPGTCSDPIDGSESPPPDEQRAFDDAQSFTVEMRMLLNDELSSCGIGADSLGDP